MVFLCVVRQFLEQAHGGNLGWKVEKGSGFVEQNDGRVLRQRLGYEHALAFAVAQCTDGAVGKRRGVCELHGLLHRLAVGLGGTRQHGSVGYASHFHHLGRGERFGLGFEGEHHTHGARQLACAK